MLHFPDEITLTCVSFVFVVADDVVSSMILSVSMVISTEGGEGGAMGKRLMIIVCLFIYSISWLSNRRNPLHWS